MPFLIQTVLNTFSRASYIQASTISYENFKEGRKILHAHTISIVHVMIHILRIYRGLTVHSGPHFYKYPFRVCSCKSYFVNRYFHGIIAVFYTTSKTIRQTTKFYQISKIHTKRLPSFLSIPRLHSQHKNFL